VEEGTLVHQNLLEDEIKSKNDQIFIPVDGEGRIRKKIIIF